MIFLATIKHEELKLTMFAMEKFQHKRKRNKWEEAFPVRRSEEESARPFEKGG